MPQYVSWKLPGSWCWCSYQAPVMRGFNRSYTGIWSCRRTLRASEAARDVHSCLDHGLPLLQWQQLVPCTRACLCRCLLLQHALAGLRVAACCIVH